MPCVSQLKEAFSLGGTSLKAREDAIAKYAPLTIDDEYYFRGLVMLQRLQEELQKSSSSSTPVTRQPTKAEAALIKEMEALLVDFGRALRGGSSAKLTELRARYHLLAFFIDTEASVRFLKKELDLDFLLEDKDGTSDSPSETISENVAHRHPTSLDPSILEPERVVVNFLRKQNDINGRERLALEATAVPLVTSLAKDGKLGTAQEESLLTRVLEQDFSRQTTDMDLEKLIASLWEKSGNPHSFPGGNALLRNLTLKQLTELRQRLVPSFANATALVEAIQEKLLPAIPPTDNVWDDPDGTLARSLDRQWNFAKTLPDTTYHAFQTSVLMRQLRVDIVRSQFSSERLLNYLKFSRYSTSHSSGFQYNNRNDNGLVAAYIEGLVDSKKLASLEALEAFPTFEDYLKPYLATALLTRPNGDQASACINVLGTKQYKELIERKKLGFSDATIHSSPRRFATDMVNVTVRIKNIRRLAIRVFQIDMFNYWRQHPNGTDIKTTEKMDLDGLCPTWEKQIEYAHVPEITVQTETFSFGKGGLAPEIFDGRGLWVIDLVGGREQCRAITQKGQLVPLIQSTTAGHLIRILDEHETSMRDTCKIWYSNTYYKPDDSGNILIPYRAQGQGDKDTRLLLVTEDGFCQPVRFKHKEEVCTLAFMLYVNPETLLPDKQTKIFVTPKLMINDCPAPLTLLKNVSLTLATMDVRNVKSTTRLENITLMKDSPVEMSFYVPHALFLLELTMTAKIDATTTHDLSCKRDMLFNSSPTAIANAHLRQTHSDGYLLYVLGKNGEPQPQHIVNLNLKHTYLEDCIPVTLQTNDEGIIRLGKLEHITSLFTDVSKISKSWRIQQGEHDNAAYIPATIHVPENTPFKLPCSTISTCVLLQNDARGNHVDDVTHLVSREQGYATISGLPSGKYQFSVGNDGCERCTIVVGRSLPITTEDMANRWSGWLVGREEVAKGTGLPLTRPLGIHHVDLDERQIRIHLSNWASSTFALVTASAFVPTSEDSLYARFIKSSQTPSPDVQQICRDTPSIFLSGRKLSEEHQYIMNRERTEKRVGSMLAKPSMLIHPEKNASTTSNARHLDGANDFKSVNKSASNAITRASLERDTMCCSSSFLPAPPYGEVGLGFLNEECPVLTLKPDGDGTLVIDRAALGKGNILQVYVQSNQQTVARELILPDLELCPLSTRDLTNAPDSIDYDCPRFQTKSVSLMGHMPGDSTMSPSSETLKLQHKWAMVATFERLFELYKDLSPNHVSDNLIEFDVLVTWPTMDEERKLKTLDKMNCHEIHLWLKKKDEDFFRQHVQPLIQSKIHKSFMDYYLIDEDLTPFATSLTLYQGLNAAEKVLLATRVPDMKSSVYRDLKDAVAFMSNLTDDRAFDIILAGSGAATDMEPQMISSPMSCPQPPPPSAPAAPTGAFSFGSAAGGYGQPAGSPVGYSMLAKAAPRSLFRSVTSEQVEQDSLDEVHEIEEGAVDEQNEEENAREEEELREKAKRQQTKVAYKFTKPTTEWIERGYYEMDVQEAAGAIQPSPFWIDVLQSTPGTPILSKNFMYATNSLTEVLFAMAILDIPFQQSARWEQKVDTDRSEISIEAHSPSILVYRTMTKAHGDLQSDSAVSIRQGFYIKGDGQVDPLSERYDPVSHKEFCHGIDYGWHLAVSNMSPKACVCDITMQVPIGSIPTGVTMYCESKTIRVEPFSTWREIVGSFYFPNSDASFVHLPVVVSREDTVLAYTPMVRHDRLVPAQDGSLMSSWVTVASRGTGDQVIQYLSETEHLRSMDLSLITWRMREAGFARQVFNLLGQQRRHYVKELWAYGVYHGFPDVVRELLEMDGATDGLLGAVGIEFESPLITVQPLLTHTLDILDYYPLIHARAHPLGTQHEILNKEFYAQYDKFLTSQSQKVHQDATDLTVFAFYLVLQDRIAEAEDVYQRAMSLRQQEQERPGRPSAEIQLDYLGAYLKTRLCADQVEMSPEELDLTSVRETARKHLKSGSLRWRKLFAGLEELVNQVDSSRCSSNPLIKSDNHLRAMQSEPLLDFVMVKNQIELQYANVASVEVRYYPIHVEALFSSNPFLGQGAKLTSDQSNWVKPSLVECHTLPESESASAAAQSLPAEGEEDDFEMIGIGKAKIKTHRIELAPQMRDKHVMIEVSSQEGRDLCCRQTHFSHQLMVHMSETYGIVRVVSQQTRRPLPGAYVKVYAKVKKEYGGSEHAAFWKDGYTGLNGVFDYVSVTEGNALVKGGDELRDIVEKRIQKFSILIMSSHDGTIVREAYPPPCQEA